MKELLGVSKFANSPLRLDRDDRRQLVTSLAAEGMSARAIAPVVGVDRDTVAADLRCGSWDPRRLSRWAWAACGLRCHYGDQKVPSVGVQDGPR